MFSTNNDSLYKALFKSSSTDDSIDFVLQRDLSPIPVKKVEFLQTFVENTQYFSFSNGLTADDKESEESIIYLSLEKDKDEVKEFVPKAKEVCEYSKSDINRLVSQLTVEHVFFETVSKMLKDQAEPGNFLKNKDLSPRARAKMVNWMIYIFKLYQFKLSTLFFAINIMDRYFATLTSSNLTERLHIVGMVSMHLGLKLDSEREWSLETLREYIGSNKFSSRGLLSVENQILKAFDYNLLKPTVYEFVTWVRELLLYNIYNDFALSEKSLLNRLNIFEEKSPIENFFLTLNVEFCPRFREIFVTISDFLSKLSMVDYTLSCWVPSVLGVGVIYATMKFCQKYLNNYIPAEHIVFELTGALNIKQSELLVVANRIQYLVRVFSSSTLSELDELTEEFNAVRIYFQ